LLQCQQVADTIQIYQLRAGSIRRLHGHRAAGHPMPATSDTAAIHKLSEQLEEEERAGDDRRTDGSCGAGGFGGGERSCTACGTLVLEAQASDAGCFAAPAAPCHPLSVSPSLLYTRPARRAEVLKARDVRSCQLRANAVLSPLNPNRICPQTKLRYGDCCGRPQQARARKDETSVPGATGAKPKRAQKTPKWVKQMHRRHAHAG
jgi:hypothetical protein